MQSGVSQAPIFALDKEDHWRVQGLRTASVRLVAAGGGTTVVVTADGHIVRMGADRGDEPERACPLSQFLLHQLLCSSCFFYEVVTYRHFAMTTNLIFSLLQ